MGSVSTMLRLLFIFVGMTFSLGSMAMGQNQVSAYRQIHKPMPIYTGSQSGQISSLPSSHPFTQVPSQSIFRVNPNVVRQQQGSVAVASSTFSQLIYAPQWSANKINAFNRGRFLLPLNHLLKSQTVTLALAMAMQKKSFNETRERREEARERARERREEARERRRHRRSDRFEGFYGMGVVASGRAADGDAGIDIAVDRVTKTKSKSFSLKIAVGKSNGGASSSSENESPSLTADSSESVDSASPPATSTGVSVGVGAGDKPGVGVSVGVGDKEKPGVGVSVGVGTADKPGVDVSVGVGDKGQPADSSEVSATEGSSVEPAGFLPSENKEAAGDSSSVDAPRFTANSFMEIIKGKGLFKENKFICEKESVNQCQSLSANLENVDKKKFSSIKDSKQRQNEFVEWLKPAVQYWGMLTGIPPSLIVSQAVLESGSGSSQRFRQDNNLFSIYCGKIGDIQTSLGEVKVEGVSCNGTAESGHSGSMTTPKDFDHALKYYLAYLTSKMKTIYPGLDKAVKKAKSKGPLEMADVNELLEVQGYENVKCGGKFVQRPKYALTKYACDPSYRDSLLTIVKKHKEMDSIACKDCLNGKLNGSESSPAAMPKLIHAQAERQ